MLNESDDSAHLIGYNIKYLPLKIAFIFTNGADHDELLHSAVSHFDPHCL